MARIRLIVADDHSLFRRGLAGLLAETGEFSVAGEACTGAEAVELARSLRPDVVLMDVHMPGGGGVEAVRQLQATSPAIPVVMLTVSDKDEDLFNAIRAGARGYLLKSAELDELCGALKQAAAGQAVIDPLLTERLFHQVVQSSTDTATPLSQRETEILQLVAAGCTNREVAARLSVSENTVKTHLARIFEKLGTTSRSEAASLARARGWMR